MKNTTHFLSMVLIATALWGCAESWREGDTGVSSQEVRQDLETLKTMAMGQSGLQRAIQLFDQGGIVYFAEGPGKLGPWYSTVPLDFEAFIKGYDPAAGKLRVYYFVLETDQGTETALVLKFMPSGQGAQPAVLAYSSNGPAGKFEDNSFVDDLDGPLLDAQLSNRLLVRSDDVADGRLQDNIQLQLSSIDISTGAEVSLGQISTLIGHQVQ